MIDLARALARDPQLLLLDEITAALPSDLAERVFTVMRRQRERGRSVLFITHRLNEVIQTCDRATILRDGGAVATIVPEEGGEETIVAYMLGARRRAGGRGGGERDAAAPARRLAGEPRRASALEVEDLAVGRRRRASRSRSPGRGPRHRRARGPGAGRAVRRARRRSTRRRRRDPRRRPPAEGASPVRRDPRRASSSCPPTACTRCCRSARCARTSPRRATTPCGAGARSRCATRAAACGDAIDALQIDTRAAPPGAPALRRQPAEGDDRALARLGLQDDALLRPDARDRRRHEAPDLRAAARASPTTARRSSSSPASWPSSRSSATAC